MGEPLQDTLIDGVLQVEAARAAPLPLLVDSPHSGIQWPDDFQPALERYYIDRATDMFVDQLIKAAPDHGATLIKALFPRTYIDPNRAEHDLDLSLIDGPWPGQTRPSEKSKLGKGLIWRLAGNGQPVYDTALSAAQVQHRIDRYHRAYHDRLEGAHGALKQRFGRVWHINCHSMKSISGPLDAEGCSTKRLDIVLSDRDGDAAGRPITLAMKAWFEAQGLAVALNDPFKGAEILRRHGNPDDQRHAVQIEINRALYMDEIALEPHHGFDDIQQLMGEFFSFVGSLLTDRQVPG